MKSWNVINHHQGVLSVLCVVRGSCRERTLPFKMYALSSILYFLFSYLTLFGNRIYKNMYTQLPQIYFHKLSYAQIGKINLMIVYLKFSKSSIINEINRIWFDFWCFSFFWQSCIECHSSCESLEKSHEAFHSNFVQLFLVLFKLHSSRVAKRAKLQCNNIICLLAL